MPGRTQLSAEAIRHIASGEIGIRAAKSKYGIGEQRVYRIRQGLEVARDEAIENKAQEDTAAIFRDRDDALQALAQERQRVATLESQNEQLRERLAATQSTHKRKKRRGRKK